MFRFFESWSDKKKDAAFLSLLFLLYLVSRFYALFLFEPHNDEILYTEFAQLTRHDFLTNAAMSLDGRHYGYFNGPLSYWLGSLWMRVVENPLTAMRLSSLLLASAGFFACCFFARNISGTSAMLFTGLGILSSQHYLYFDVLGLSEPLVYGFGMLFIWTFYQSLLDEKKTYAFWCGAAALAISLAFATKEIAKLWLILAVPVSFIAWSRKSYDRTVLLRSFLFLTGFVILGLAFWFRCVPFQFRQVRQANLDGIKIVFTVPELLGMSFETFRSQCSFYFGQILSSQMPYVWWVIFLVAPIFLMFFYRRDRPFFYAYLGLFIFYLCSFLPFLIAFRGHYPRHWGIGLYAWYLLLGVSLSAGFRYVRRGGRKWAWILFVLVLSSQTFALFRGMRDLDKWRQTDYAILETRLSRYNGIGIQAMVRHLMSFEKGFLFYPSSWSHPGVDVRVFSSLYPQLSLLPLEYFSPDEFSAVSEDIVRYDKKLHFVFDRIEWDRNPWVQTVDKHPILCARRQVIPKLYKQYAAEAADLILCSSKNAMYPRSLGQFTDEQ